MGCHHDGFRLLNDHGRVAEGSFGAEIALEPSHVSLEAQRHLLEHQSAIMFSSIWHVEERVDLNIEIVYALGELLTRCILWEWSSFWALHPDRAFASHFGDVPGGRPLEKGLQVIEHQCSIVLGIVWGRVRVLILQCLKPKGRCIPHSLGDGARD